jgi:LuxR family transcriptional regulator
MTPCRFSNPCLKAAAHQGSSFGGPVKNACEVTVNTKIPIMKQTKTPLPFVPLEAMVARAPGFAQINRRISQVATSGYFLARQVNGFFRPELAYSSFPRAWFEHYTVMDFLLLDPVLEWAAANSGAVRWSEIAGPSMSRQSVRVLAHAATYSLRYGVILSTKNQMIGLKRSFLSCARPDREFTDDEIRELDVLFHDTLSLRSLTSDLTPACREVMNMLAIGMTQIDIALHLGISRDSVKKRIERACKTLGARNASHALAMAVEGSIVSAYG